MLYPCPSCAREVSGEATTCPHCGQPLDATAGRAKAKQLEAQKRRRRRVVGGVIAVVLAIPIIKGMNTPSPSGSGITSTSTITAETTHTAASGAALEETPAAGAESTKGHFGKTYLTKAGAPVCLTVAAYKEFMSYYREKDEGALRELVETGQCGLLKEDSEVIAEDAVGPLWQLAKVRFVGARQHGIVDPKLALKGWD
jgi:hypothetical protein